jgi:molybdate transport system regulatory protein
MEIKYKIQIKKNDKVIFDKDRYNIIKAIDEKSSLNAAVKELKISYRWAWEKLKDFQETMGFSLVEININKKNMKLTRHARALIERFEKLEKDVEMILHKNNHDFQKLINDDENNSGLE